MVVFLLAPYRSSAQQDTFIRDVPLVKESPAIASLLHRIITYENSKELERDSCMLLRLLKSENDAGSIHPVHTLAHKQKVYYSFPDFGRSKNLGYFKYGRYFVFVYGDDDSMKENFKYTAFRTTYTFTNPTVDQLTTLIKGWSWFIFYKNGVFTYGVH